MPQVRLPTGVDESMRQVKKALRGDDKRFLAYNNFLGRSVGFAKEDDYLLKNFVYDNKLASYKSYLLQSLVASYMVKARSVLARDMSRPTGFSGDFVFWDASRVASKEILLVHAWIEGHFVSAPLQRLPDQSSVHAPSLAMDNVVSVVLPLAKQARANKPRRREGEATQSLMFALAQSLKAILPIKSMDVWKPTYVHYGGAGIAREKCRVSGHYYFYDQTNHESSWCLPPELRVADEDKIDIRMFVVVADEGSTGWSLFQWLALKQHLRVFWHRDPLHRLSNLFTNALKSTWGNPRCGVQAPHHPQMEESAIW